MESKGGDDRELGSPSIFWIYLQVEAVWNWVELLLADEAVPGTAAEHAGEQAEHQNVTEEDFHGAAVGSKKLKHIGDTCQLVQSRERVS